MGGEGPVVSAGYAGFTATLCRLGYGLFSREGALGTAAGALCGRQGMQASRLHCAGLGTAAKLIFLLFFASKTSDFHKFLLMLS